jgi:hypothetical protein
MRRTPSSTAAGHKRATPKRSHGDPHVSLGQIVRRQLPVALLTALTFATAILTILILREGAPPPELELGEAAAIPFPVPALAPKTDASAGGLEGFPGNDPQYLQGPPPQRPANKRRRGNRNNGPATIEYYKTQPDSQKVMFFHRAKSLEDDLRKNKKHSRNALDTITVATQLSVDRIDKRLYDMVREWNGPMSIAVYVRQYSDLRRVRSAVNASASLARLADVHLFIEGSQGVTNPARKKLNLPVPYPINVLRNMALDGVKMRANQTYIFDPLVLVIDADTKMTGTMKEATEQLRSTLAFGEGPPRFHTFDDERTVFVIPAFAHAKNELMRLEVLDKHDLREYLMKGEAEIMHATSFPISYLGSLDMWRWTFATEPYAVRYTHRWEPYYIARMGPNFPYFDERFVDRGLNKAQQQFSLFARNYRYVVVPDLFVVDTPMPSKVNRGFKPARGSGLNAAIAKSFLHFNQTYLHRLWEIFVTETVNSQNLTCDDKITKRNREIYKPRCVSANDPSHRLVGSAHVQRVRWEKQVQKAPRDHDKSSPDAHTYRSCTAHHPHVVFFSIPTIGGRPRDPAEVMPPDVRGVRAGDLFETVVQKEKNFRLSLYKDTSYAETALPPPRAALLQKDQRYKFDNFLAQTGSASAAGNDRYSRPYAELGTMDSDDVRKSLSLMMACFSKRPKSLGHLQSSSPEASKESATAAWNMYQLLNNTVRLLYHHPFPVLESTNRQGPITYISIIDPLSVMYTHQYQQMLRSLRVRIAAVAQGRSSNSILRDQCEAVVGQLEATGAAVPPLYDQAALESLLSACIPGNTLARFFCGRAHDCGVLSDPEGGNSKEEVRRRTLALRRGKDSIRNDFLVVGLSDRPESTTSQNTIATMKALGKLLPSYFGGIVDSPSFHNFLETRSRAAKKALQSSENGAPAYVLSFLQARSKYDSDVYKFVSSRLRELVTSCE